LLATVAPRSCFSDAPALDRMERVQPTTAAPHLYLPLTSTPPPNRMDRSAENLSFYDFAHSPVSVSSVAEATTPTKPAPEQAVKQEWDSLLDIIHSPIADSPADDSTFFEAWPGRSTVDSSSAPPELSLGSSLADAAKGQWDEECFARNVLELEFSLGEKQEERLVGVKREAPVFTTQYVAPRASQRRGRNTDLEIEDEESFLAAYRQAKKFKKPQPSNFCHICASRAADVGFAFCSNIDRGYCQKTVCRKCFAKFGWDFEKATNPETKWECPHCRHECPERARCHIYFKANYRRRVRRQRMAQLEAQAQSAAHLSRPPCVVPLPALE